MNILMSIYLLSVLCFNAANVFSTFERVKPEEEKHESKAPSRYV